MNLIFIFLIIVVVILLILLIFFSILYCNQKKILHDNVEISKEVLRTLGGRTINKDDAAPGAI